MKLVLAIVLVVCFSEAWRCQAQITTSPQCAAMAQTFNVYFPTSTPWSHDWEKCVGSGHALLALRADYRKQLERAKQTLGVQYVRYHGILDDDMSTYMERDNQPYYSFANIDNAFDYFISIGVKPLIELSFMPELLAANASLTVFHYKGITSPPADYHKFGTLISTLASHLIQRYGIKQVSTWPFEVWNEPNCGFWSGSQQEYFKLYQTVANAIKMVDSRLQVGGPATCASGWIEETLAFVKQNNVPMDFVSTHLYPTDFGDRNISRTIVRDTFARVRQTVGPNTPIYYTEYNSGLWCCPQSQHDDSYAASFLISNIPMVNGIVNMYSYWTFSDVFEEGGFDSAEFNGVYGYQTSRGVAKPAFRAFELLHWSGNKQLKSTPGPLAETVDLLATTNATHINLHISNWNHLLDPITTQTVCVNVGGFSQILSNDTGAFLHRIDSTSANPMGAWQSMGSPMYPTPQQLNSLHAASEMTTSTITYTITGSLPPSISISVTLPPWSVAHIAIPLNRFQ